MQRPNLQLISKQPEIPHPDVMLIESQHAFSCASAQLVHYDFHEAPDNLFLGTNSYRLELSLNPRLKNSRACYEDHWASNRFERVGNLFLLPPEQAIRGRSDEAGKMQALVFEFPQHAVHRWLDRELTWSAMQLATTLDIRSKEIQPLLLRLVDEIRHPGFANEALLELLTGQLSIELARYCVGLSENIRPRGLSGRRLKVIEECLRESADAPSVAELARLCQLSERQLARGFKTSKGCSIGHYIAGIRIERAKTLLAGDMRIKAIAITLGFSSSSPFCYAFRKATGLSPGDYRQRITALPH